MTAPIVLIHDILLHQHWQWHGQPSHALAISANNAEALLFMLAL